MTTCHIKSKGDQVLECWVEMFDGKHWHVVSESRILWAGNELLIDSMTVYPQFQRRGYGTMMVNKLRESGKRVVPIGVLKSAEAFWDKVTPGWRVGEPYRFLASDDIE